MYKKEGICEEKTVGCAGRHIFFSTEKRYVPNPQSLRFNRYLSAMDFYIIFSKRPVSCQPMKLSCFAI
ncbi:hypothetical protein TBC1_1120 [Lentimicrobium saccharophilum]|uniref:Uncharacterized protein n=1 Tax=Lentimicrobium saccharophilum TaxID=1678841 RepID=A0A0S7BY63_9BACT|nr:hypothetical protein TBC1_1120 [Lentimicrobium saccharophilum]